MKHFPLRDDGTFRICQLTDIHLEHDRLHEEREQTCALIKNAVRDTNPDLIVITGDLAWGPHDDLEIDRLASIMEELGVAWAPVLGNHDGQDLVGGGEAGREMFAGFLANRKGGLFELGLKDVAGHGNYTITVGGTPDAPKWVLYLLDSRESGFDFSQVLWYKKTSEAFGNDHSELAFFHIPIPEYDTVWDYGDCLGYNQEQVAAMPLNVGMFSAMVRRGRMRGTFVGHDHVNDFEGTLRGIRLCYGRGSGYQCYGMNGFEHGARIIDLKLDGTFDTQIYTESGALYHQQREHPHKIGSKC